VCVIGAGSSGIAACKVLKEYAIPFDCYEAGDRVGGNWVYNNSNGMSSAYRSLHINTTRPRMQFSDYPMPEHYPDFPHHTQIADYFDNYIDHFGVRPYITFKTTVVSAEPLPQGGWEVKLHNGAVKRYQALIVANGHHWDPRWPQPDFPGTFDGTIIHSHYYKTPEPYADQNVLVVGFGNSAMDIASEVSRVANKTFLSVRRGFHIVPKHVLGRPLDQSPIPKFLPFWLERSIRSFGVNLTVGDLARYGLPKPDHKLFHAHPTISSDILTRLSHGKVLPKPNIDQLDGDGVFFTDGSWERIDRIIYCTGYKVTFPFFRPELLNAADNELPLFQRVFHPQYPDLFFLGLLQPLGAIMPLAELQSHWIAQYLQGEYQLPEPEMLQKTISQEREAIRKRYGESARHTMQVDYEPYVRAVRREMKRGQKRRQASAGVSLIRPDKAFFKPQPSIIAQAEAVIEQTSMLADG
jgi:hypothetical protein